MDGRHYSGTENNSQKNVLIWRKTGITINLKIFYDRCMAVDKIISKSKVEPMEQMVINCEGDVCLFVCFVGLFHIGNWNFWLVMPSSLGYRVYIYWWYVMCFELVCLLCTINSAECHCVSEIVYSCNRRVW